MAELNVELVRKMLRLLGIGQKRLVDLRFAPNDRPVMVEELWKFAGVIDGMGPNPAKPVRLQEAS